MKVFNKVAVIGLDCAITHLVEKHIEEGVLPNFKKLFDNGTVCDNALVPFPTITPPNWATICTGAYPGTHGVTDFWVHIPGTTPTNSNTLSAFNSKWVQAETIWEAAERQGKKSIVFNYPGSWPTKMKNSIVVGGRGLSIGLVYDGHKHMNKHIDLCADMLFTTDNIYGTVNVSFEKAKDWKNVDDMGDSPLETVVEPNFPHAERNIKPIQWYFLIRDLDDGYDTLTVSPTRDFNDAYFTIKVGEWTEKIFINLETEEGKEEVFFNAKLLKLSDDADDFSLFFNPFVRTQGWCSPSSIDKEIRDVPGSLGNSGGYMPYTLGWIDAETWIEINYQHAEYNGTVASKLLSNHDWDLFFMHHHLPDWAYHNFLTELDMKTAKSKESYELAWHMHREMYKACDKMLGQIIEACPEDTCIVLVSDHGAVMDGPNINPNDILKSAGLLHFEEQEVDVKGLNRVGASVNAMFAQEPDLTKSKALPQRVCYIYVNLKGRYPGGIVEPEDYEKVQQEIIDALYAYKHPDTGERCIALALSKQDARLLGLHGDGIGDVVYAVKPEYSSQHGQILPTATWGIGSLHALLTFTGPGIKKGQRLDRTCNIADVVPTLCYGGDIYSPKQCEGSVLYQIFENPDMKVD